VGAGSPAFFTCGPVGFGPCADTGSWDIRANVITKATINDFNKHGFTGMEMARTDKSSRRKGTAWNRSFGLFRPGHRESTRKRAQLDLQKQQGPGSDDGLHHMMQKVKLCHQIVHFLLTRVPVARKSVRNPRQC
jgi:hypothetical protein